MSIKKIDLIIILTSLTFANLANIGIYGYGIDVIYSYSSFSYDSTLFIRDKFGYLLTLSKFNILTVSFLLSFSLGYLIKYYFVLINIKSLFLFLIIYFFLIHSWPILMGSINVLRQGLAISIFFLSIILILKKNFKLFFLVMIIGFFTHNSFLFIIFTYFCYYIFYILKRKIKINKKKFFFFNFFFSITLFYYLSTLQLETLNIGKNYTHVFFIISIIMLYFFLNDDFDDFTKIYIFIFLSISLALYFNQLNYQYERIMMYILIPSILQTAKLIKHKYKYLVISTLILTLLTFKNNIIKTTYFNF